MMPPQRHPNMACKPTTTPTCCDATLTRPRPATTPPQCAQDPQCHPITACKTCCDTDPPQHARLTTMPTCNNATKDKTCHNATMMPTCPTNNKTHPNTTPSCMQDLL